jgi:hypothetical protein
MARSSDVALGPSKPQCLPMAPNHAQGRPSGSLLRLDHHLTTEASVVLKSYRPSPGP